MIDPSSSEEEGDDDAVVNVASKGRIGAPHKSLGSIPGPSSSSSSGAAIPAVPASSSKIQNGDFSGNQRISNVIADNGAAKTEQPQLVNEGGNLGIPSNGIPRFVYK